MSDDELLDILMHDAGHAVVALVLGFLGGRVTIKPTTDALGTAEYFRVFYKPRRYYHPNTKSLARAVILVHMAGPIAAFYLRDVPMDASCNDDFKNAYAEANTAGIEHERKRLNQYAFRLVQRHCEKITRVASELVERKSGGTMSA